MDNLALERLINEANLLLIRSEEELNKPQGQTMSLAACQNAKLSMYKLLHAYLVKHKIEVSGEENLVQLYEKCRDYNPAFNQVTVPEMGCVSDNSCSMEEYCIHSNFVAECVERGKEIRKLLYTS